jgi:hypothetical protein
MSQSTRREFVKSSATAAAGLTVIGTLVSEQAAEAAAVPDATDAANTKGTLVAYVSNPAMGEVVLMHGEETKTVRDRKLATRLARAAR